MAAIQKEPGFTGLAGLAGLKKSFVGSRGGFSKEPLAAGGINSSKKIKQYSI
jgi:hypothetical protein